MCAQAASREKSVQPTQSCIRMQKPLKAQKLYNLRKAVYIAKSRTQTCAKSVQRMQSHI